MILAPTPRERERWYAMLLLAQGWGGGGQGGGAGKGFPHYWPPSTSSGGRRPSAKKDLQPLIFEQTGGSPSPLTERSRRS